MSEVLGQIGQIATAVAALSQMDKEVEKVWILTIMAQSISELQDSDYEKVWNKYGASEPAQAVWVVRPSQSCALLHAIDTNGNGYIDPNEMAQLSLDALITLKPIVRNRLHRSLTYLTTPIAKSLSLMARLGPVVPAWKATTSAFPDKGSSSADTCTEDHSQLGACAETGAPLAILTRRVTNQHLAS
jgi:hypothetical protein